MEQNRRQFIKFLSLISSGLVCKPSYANFINLSQGNKPVVISTWPYGAEANKAAWELLSKGLYALDAVEAGTKIPENNYSIKSAGFGSYPDLDGKITLEGSIMDENGRFASVSNLQHIKNPVSLSKMILEKYGPTSLSGKKAFRFAKNNGFKEEKLLTNELQKGWKEAKNNKTELIEIQSERIREIENIYPFGMLALDMNNKICGACSSGGAPYKVHGSIGSASFIGAGIYIENGVGGAITTGDDHLIIQEYFSHYVIDLMREGDSPEDACWNAMMKVYNENYDARNKQLHCISINSNGEIGASSMQPGFTYAVQSASFSEINEASSVMKLR